ncbi:MAG: glycoside hydrolase family 88 protein [Firmicutes bacterium]|nr:glycoside hydrolase family 88 protein [Bacillota bacterium]
MRLPGLLREIVRPHQALLVAAVACVLAATAAGLSVPLLFRDLVDRITVTGDLALLQQLALLGLGVFVLRSLFLYGQIHLNFTFAHRATADLRDRLFSRVLRWPVDRLGGWHSAEVMSRALQDTQLVHTHLLVGLVDLLRFLPHDQAGRESLQRLVRRHLDALLGLQDQSGHWHTVLDRPETYLETSVAAMMAWTIPQAVRLGIARSEAAAGGGQHDPSGAAARAFDAAMAALDAQGGLTGVSEATPAGDLSAYAARPTGVFPWGQGPLLLAMADRLAPDRLWEGLW